MATSTVCVGIMQRNVPLRSCTIEALDNLSCKTILVDSSPVPLEKKAQQTIVIHQPDCEGFFAIALLIPLFTAFLKTGCQKLFLIEGDMVLTAENIEFAAHCKDNTKVFYQESEPANPYAYVRREGLAGILLRNECERILRWMSSQNLSCFKRYQGYCDTFLWFAVSSESTGYSQSTSGPNWVPVLHMTHDDYTRVTKAQRKDMKVYRARIAEIIALAMKCNNAS